MYPSATSTRSTLTTNTTTGHGKGHRICEMDPPCVHSKCRGSTSDLELSKLPSRGASDVYIRPPHETSVNCHCSQCNLGHSSAIYLPGASQVNEPAMVDSRVILGEMELDEETSLSGSSVSPCEGASSYCHYCCHHKNQLDCHSEVDEILTEMKFITNRMRREDASNDIVMEYRLCALVIDRCCLYLFTTVTVISTILCISKAPHLIV